MPEAFLFRADTSTEIGTGHVMRCLALAQAAQEDGHPTTFIMAKQANGLIERLKSEQCEVIELESERGSIEDANETAELVKKLSANLVIDGYAFTDEYQKTLKQNDIRFMLVDDYGQAVFSSADLILNQNCYAHSLDDIYAKRAPDSELLMGPDYTLLRREFRNISPQPKLPEIAKRILVTLGGGDPDNVTQRIVKLLKQIDGLDVTVVVGEANKQLNSIKSQADKMNVVVDAKNMHELMAQSDLAISASGTTTYELAYMGVPTLAFVIANNQEPVACDMEERGAIKSLGRSEDLSDDEFLSCLKEMIVSLDIRKRMSDAGRTIIDGKGAERVLAKLVSILNA